jgi:hypothetical protein
MCKNGEVTMLNGVRVRVRCWLLKKFPVSCRRDRKATGNCDQSRGQIIFAR